MGTAEVTGCASSADPLGPLITGIGSEYLRGLRPLSHFPSETRFPGRKRGQPVAPQARLAALGVGAGRGAAAEDFSPGQNSGA